MGDGAKDYGSKEHYGATLSCAAQDVMSARSIYKSVCLSVLSSPPSHTPAPAVATWPHCTLSEPPGTVVQYQSVVMRHFRRFCSKEGTLPRVSEQNAKCKLEISFKS